MSANKLPPPSDTPLEAEFRAFAREWAEYILAPERTDDQALDDSIMAGADPATLRSALKFAAMRRSRVEGRPMIAGHHRHYRDKYIAGLCGAAVGAGIKRAKARRIVGDVFGLDKATIRGIDRNRGGDPPDTG